MEHKCTCKAGYNGEVLHCPLHQSADAMYEALEAVDDYLSASYPENMKLKQIAADKLVSALALARRV